MSEPTEPTPTTPNPPPKSPPKKRAPRKPKAPSRLRDRSTGDLLVLMVAGTVCFTVLATGLTIAIVEIIHPESDTSGAVRTVAGVINTLIGLLAGFLAGRTDLSMRNSEGGPAE